MRFELVEHLATQIVVFLAAELAEFLATRAFLAAELARFLATLIFALLVVFLAAELAEFLATRAFLGAGHGRRFHRHRIRRLFFVEDRG